MLPHLRVDDEDRPIVPSRAPLLAASGRSGAGGLPHVRLRRTCVRL